MPKKAPARKDDVDTSRLFWELGYRIRVAREAAELTQLELAGRAGLSRVSIANTEAGRQHPPLDVIYRIAQALDTKLTRLLPAVDYVTRLPPANLMKRHKGTVIATHVVGDEHTVLTVTSPTTSSYAHQRRACAECPWRRDRPTGVFPADAFRHSARTAYDGAFNTFACHMAGVEATMTCAGFLLRNADNNIGVRIAIASGRLSLDAVEDTAPLYDSYREMAIANGVAPDDPAIQPCRANGALGRR